MSPIRLYYNHVFYSCDGSIIPLVPAHALPTDIFCVLPPTDLSSIVALRESSKNSSRRASIVMVQTPLAKSNNITDTERPMHPEPSSKQSDDSPSERCAYFHRRDGCKRGSQCRFLHDSPEAAQKIRMVVEKSWRDLPSANISSAHQGKLQTSKSESPVSSSMIKCVTPGRTPSSTDPQRLIKTHCTYFLRFGECDYWPDCKFSHEMPERGRATKVMGNSCYSWGRLGEAPKDSGKGIARGPGSEKEEIPRGKPDCDTTSNEPLIISSASPVAISCLVLREFLRFKRLFPLHGSNAEKLGCSSHSVQC